MAEVFDFGLQQHKIKMDGKFFKNNLFAVAGYTGADRISNVVIGGLRTIMPITESII